MYFLRKTQVNDTRGWIFNDGDWERVFEENTKTIFKMLQKDHGRCTGKMFVDGKDGSTKHIGWVFEKRECYSDRNGLRQDDFFRCETWVECCPASDRL